MPPSKHSSSSHSSRSHHSSHSSHSSRSHSSSSHSSRSYGSSYHSSTSHSSSVIPRKSPYIGTNNFIKKRKSQPTGYKDYSRVTGYRCKKHEYVYYPTDWDDETSGTFYKKGYYDEDGNRYENLILKHNQSYENVPLKCEYCGNTLVRDLTDDTENMRCDICGGVMKIDAILDEADDTPATFGQTLKNSSTSNLLIILSIIFMFIIACCCNVIFAGTSIIGKDPDAIVDMYPDDDSNNNSSTVSDTDIFGQTIYVKCNGDEYSIVNSDDDFDKKLYWDYGYDSYYDKETDCYVWYNTDVSPNLWQYWYEGISSDYGNYGWMEYENGKWYIETSNNNWEELDVQKYDTSRLWHFESSYIE